MHHPITTTHDICLLQAGDDADTPCVMATVLPTQDVWLVQHSEGATVDEPGQSDATIALTPEGWTTLVELYALRRPEAWARLCAKVATLQAAQGKEPQP